ncbi:root hair defective 3 GTP-binding protein-domain-containing protein [Infundibulicybe gibba]|nr:root hair defective 3 GTP-binding protein-domain-containing protein [Infundibulicybe gibba]
MGHLQYKVHKAHAKGRNGFNNISIVTVSHLINYYIAHVATVSKSIFIRAFGSNNFKLQHSTSTTPGLVYSLDFHTPGHTPVLVSRPLPTVTATPSERIQIVNDEKEFTKDLGHQIERWGLRDAGFGYNLVAVFGSQSTGKSTLLNRLFGTTFDVMDETRRQQTTKGIWMCKGQGMDVMVMDVEGTDGRERGEDQDFERKSALFSLASSEILIVNLWEHQVGLYQGANMGLLKTVFEVNLGLFGKTNTRTLLLFVIRDHIGQTPLANLQATLTADLNRIWDGLSKPAELKDRQLSDYFDMVFTALPHKILSADKFESEVQNLRKRFVNKERDGYLFKPAYHKRIPADGVSFYMESIWDQVQNNKDLDLPTQQELLAQFRCDEISNSALAEFNEQAKSQKRPVETGHVVKGLGSMMSDWRSRAIERYDRDASRYHKGNLHKTCLFTFKQEMLDGLRGQDCNFAEVVKKAREDCEGKFTEVAKEALVEGTTWNWEEELLLLQEEVKSVADQCRRDETKKMVNLIERNFKRHISEPVELYMNKASPDMWDSVLKAFNETLSKAEESYLSKAKTFNCTEEENILSLNTLRIRAWQALRAKIDEQTADAVLLGKLRGHFEERFRYDEQGVPRVWKPEDDIDGAFKKAKDQTLELISLFAKIAPIDPALEFTPPPNETADTLSADEFDFSSSLTVLSETKSIDLSTRFRRDADAYYVEAKRSTVASIAQIPLWMYGVLVVLGWNEAMAVLFNPLYFTFLLVALASAYGIIQLGLVGPLLQVTRTIGGEVQRQAGARLREHFAEPIPAVPVRASSTDADDDARQDLRRRQA